jgi:hypothetical protein
MLNVRKKSLFFASLAELAELALPVAKDWSKAALGQSHGGGKV